MLSSDAPVLRLFAGLSAVALIGLGIPQATDALLQLYAAAGRDQPELKTAPAQKEAQASADLLDTAEAWSGDPQARIDAGLLRFRLASEAGYATIDLAQLARSVDDLTHGLARAPGNSHAWLVLGYADFIRGEMAGAASDFRTSVFNDPYDPNLVVARCELGLRLLPLLAADDRRLLDEQLRFAWDIKWPEIVALAKKGYRTQIEEALANDTVRLADFLNAYYGSIRPPLTRGSRGF